MRRSNRGQVVVESALSMTAFLLVLVGMLDFGRGFFQWQTIAVCAREGARWGIVHGSEAGLSVGAAQSQGLDYIQTKFGSSLPKDAKVTFSFPDGANTPGNAVRVKIEADYKPVTPLLGKKTVKLQSVSEMQIIY